jgi:flagellar FliL protein
MLVNLQTDGTKTSFIKMAVSLELTDKSPVTTERVTAMMPRVIDNFQVYMRELRLDDLNGSAGMFRLKEELLRRVNIAVQPVQVKDILFRELLVQ